MYFLSQIYFIVVCCSITKGIVSGKVDILGNTKYLDIFKAIGDIILTNYEKNSSWSAMLCYGDVPDEFYYQIRHLHLTRLHIDSAYTPTPSSEDGFPYRINTVLMVCSNSSDCHTAFKTITEMTSWNPHAKIIIYLKELEDDMTQAKLFYTLWWHQCLNALVLYYVEHSHSIDIYNYTPYSHAGFQLQTAATCWSRKHWVPNYMLDIALISQCHAGCENLTVISNLPRKYLTTCISFDKRTLNLHNILILPKYIHMKDQTINLHGYPLKAFGEQIPPFLHVEFYGNGSFKLQQRDGEIWTTLADRMNFTVELVALESFESPFSYQMNTNMIFKMSYRIIDFIMYPIYQLDLVVSTVDLLFPIRDSGVCIVAHRADYVANWFETAHFNYSGVALFVACMMAIWSTIALFQYFEKGRLSLDQLGKDFCNMIRNMLTVCLHKPPLIGSFRIYLIVSLWCFFLVNFVIQASIMSFLTVLKRGKEVETFADVVERGYPVQGFWSPDMILPESEEVFTKFNELQVHIQEMYSCVEDLEHNPRLFCLLDCTMAKYFELNKLHKGEPYLHVLRDKVHSRFLNMALPHRSPLSHTMNKYLMGLAEGGLIKKFEGSRYDKIHEESPEVKPITLDNVSGIFKLLSLAMGSTVVIFLCEVAIGYLHWFKCKNYLKDKMCWCRFKLKRKKKFAIKPIEVSTQTEYNF